MRWMWIDRFLEFQRGKRAVARKNINLVEEPIDEYCSGFPHFPASLIVEGLAQTAGLLVGEVNGFHDRVVLAKLGKASFHFLALPGDTLTYTAEVLDIKEGGAMCRCTSRLEDRVQAEIEVVFAYLDERFPKSLFEPVDFLSMIRLFGLYDVAVDEHGNRLTPPQHLLDAEREALANY